MRRALITGIAGFAGAHLAGYLKDKAEVWGVDLSAAKKPVAAGQAVLIKCDLTDPSAALEAVKNAAPDAVFHLAAQSSPALSLVNPAETLRVNVFSTLNLFEAVLKAAPDAVVLNVGSGDEYGQAAPDDLPVKESANLRPANPYALSKVTADLMGFQYWSARGLKVVRCRPFNHYGPGQSDAFVASSFARRIAEIEAGINQDNTLKTGSLEAHRDFLDIRDVVSAYELLVEKGAPGEVYNICSGEPVRIGKLLDTLMGFSDAEIEVAQDPSRLRPNEANVVYGDPSRLKSLGWSRRISLEKGLEDLLDFWRLEIKGGEV